MTRYLVVPQWQGSPSSRAMQLIDGAQAIAGDLPRAATTVLDVPTEAGDSRGTGVHRLSALLGIREQAQAALSHRSEPVLTVGGDAGVAVAPVAHAIHRAPGVALVWLGAHPAFHTPETSPSGAFAGMVLRSLVGEGVDGLALPAGTLHPDRVLLAGARSFDDAEVPAVAAGGIRTVAADALAEPGSLAEAVRETGAEAIYVHVDVDVLDPSELSGNAHPAPFGPSVAELTAAIGRLRAEVPLVGASLSGYSPASPAVAEDDLGALLRLIGALA